MKGDMATAHVLNLIINGLPSILNKKGKRLHYTELSFKPYYKWITFNTGGSKHGIAQITPIVLNLIINGLPSIL